MFKVLFASSIALVAGAPDYDAWWTTKKAETGVHCFGSGLCVKALIKGSGKVSPTKSSPCEVHYTGTLIDGTKFDSSRDRGSPITFAPNQVIKGWTEAMQYMVEGDRWEMYIPSDLGYGSRGAGAQIPGGATLVFDMEILKIKGDTQAPQFDADLQEMGLEL